ncbi:arginyl-tRNA synthetase, mitochondrial [Brevipalpus obovatus]|uniref:arginyl-tRNA synthetase, mitochondrial n=1 Tax=Brevipalpus obovatus TaxID=246614 RepID=UPI003D9E9038
MMVERDCLIRNGVNTLRCVAGHGGGSLSSVVRKWMNGRGVDGGKRCVVDFSSPNIAKPFHCGHLRSTLIGNALVNIGKCLGHDMVKINYLGDWGTQFGLLSHGYDCFGDEGELRKNAIGHLFDVYVKANCEAEKDDNFLQESKRKFASMEKFADEMELKKWQLFREYSMKEYTKVYDDLGITFDDYEFESMYMESGRKYIDQLERSGVLNSVQNGAKIVDIEMDNGKIESIPVLKEDGSTLYITRDIAAAIERKKKYDFDEMFYVVGHTQSKHFRLLKRILSKMNYQWAENLHHVSFGKIKGMSTRKGEVVFLQDIIDDATSRCKESTLKSSTTKSSPESFDYLAKILGLSALFVYDLRAPKGISYDFDWDEALKSKGFTGLYLQYSHARVCSIERKAGFDVDLSCSLDLSALEGDLWDKLFSILSRLEDTIVSSSNKCEPSILVRYLLTLSQRNNACIENFTVKDQPENIAKSRLLVFHGTRMVLNQGMKLIGLKPLDII